MALFFKQGFPVIKHIKLKTMFRNSDRSSIIIHYKDVKIMIRNMTVLAIFVIAIMQQSALARYYKPETGRFLQEDTVWSTNLYIYAENIPTIFSDPFGDKITIKGSPSEVSFIETLINDIAELDPIFGIEYSMADASKINFTIQTGILQYGNYGTAVYNFRDNWLYFDNHITFSDRSFIFFSSSFCSCIC
ncbi:MAG TPA: RHS repeat-associated core domain-containing protein [bacterium]|nr:RHS repeat-associated core domain-containing protein [bacterium]